MTISVVIASYKYGHLASHAVDSVVCQTRKADKIYLLDDGIGDCREVAARYPEIELIERKENMGVVDNFQDMLMRLDTDKALYLGADNWLRQDCLEKLSSIEADIVSYDLAITGTQQQFNINRFWNGYMVWKPYPAIHGSSLYNVNSLKKLGGMKEIQKARIPKKIRCFSTR